MEGAKTESLIANLRQVGLSRYEASVYLGLVCDQTARVAEISRRTGVPQPKVYQALESLIEKGCCSLAVEVAKGTGQIHRTLLEHIPKAPHSIEAPGRATRACVRRHQWTQRSHT